MSVSELNELMTYVVEGWMLFSAGFIGTTFISFVSKRIQEDMEAAELAQTEGVSAELSESVVETEAATAVETTAAAQPVAQSAPAIAAPKPSTPKPSDPAPPDDAGEGNSEDTIDVDEAARLKEVAAVSEKLAKEKQKQSGSSSVSVST